MLPPGETRQPGVIACGRPVLVVSSDAGNESSESFVALALTRTPRGNKSINVMVNVGNLPSYVLCNQIVTVGKQQLVEKKNRIAAEEMREVDAALMLALGLGTPVEDTVEEQEQYVGDQVNYDLYKMAYEKVLGELVDLRIEHDRMMLERFETAKKQVSEPKKEPEPKNPENLENLEKINVNTASSKELIEKLHIPYKVACSISATRKKVGRYDRLEDLLVAEYFTEHHLKKYGDRLTV